VPVYVPLLFMAVPLVIGVLFFGIVRSYRRGARGAVTVPDGWVRAPGAGVVVDEKTWRTRSRGEQSGAFVRQPTVRYRAATGADITFVSPVYATWMPRPGTAVGVVHDPHDPARARIAPESIPRRNRALGTVALVVGVCIWVPLTAIFELLGWFLLTHR
jgi:hypothetical protein